MQSKVSTKQVLGYYLKIFLKERWLFSLITFSGIIVSVLSLVFPILVKQFVDIVSNSQDVSQSGPELWGVFWNVAILSFITLIFWRLLEIGLTYFEPKVGEKIYKECFNYLQRHSFKFFSDNFSGSLVKKTSRLVSGAEELADIFAFEFLKIVVSVIFVFGVIFYLNPFLGILFLAWSILFILISLILSKWRMKFSLDQYEKDSLVTGFYSDSVTNNFNISIFSSLKRELKSFSKVLFDWRKAREKSWWAVNFTFLIVGIFIVSFDLTVIYFSIDFITNGIISIGTFVLIQIYLVQVMDLLAGLSILFRRFFNLIANSAEMIEVLNTPHEIKDISGAKELKLKKGEIEFKNVNFYYKDGIEVFENFNLKIKPGEKVALVGESGAGKSSIVKLLFRFFDIQKGEILIDGQNISKVTQDSLRGNISLVPQDSILFHRSLRENIAYGKENATEEEIIHASKKANCHDFIGKLPDGYDSMVGERGIKLSGGERQRIAIARALLENAKIFVFDEATSALDSESEKLIQKSLDEAMKGKTSIIIAHRLSTVMKADRIIVLENGKVVEDGRHEDLLKKDSGIYKKLWEIQSGGFI